MPETSLAQVAPEEIDRRLRESGLLYELGRALREVRVLDVLAADCVHEPRLRGDSDEASPQEVQEHRPRVDETREGG